MSRYYTTKSGSMYEVIDNRVRRIKRSPASAAERVSEAWREAQAITCDGVGHPLVIVWGFGQDEHSSSAVQVGDGTSVLRTTRTTPVTTIETVR